MTSVKALIKVAMVLSYEGTDFFGWQRQVNATPTIQAEVEKVLSQICSMRLTVMSSGRTDSGVHARVQVIHTHIPAEKKEEHKSLPFERLFHGMNSLLPPSVRVLFIEEVTPEFHAIKSVEKKTYLYFLATTAVSPPALSRYMWHLRFPLDWELMQRAAEIFRGRHYFKAFCDANGSAKTFHRTVFESSLSDEISLGTFPWCAENSPKGYRVFRVTGSGFLKHMVRSLVGTLVSIGQGRRTISNLHEALRTGERKLVGPTAPANGLWLWDIKYR